MNFDKSIINRTDTSKCAVFGDARLKGALFGGFVKNDITDDKGNVSGAWYQVAFMIGMETFYMTASADSGVDFLERGKMYDIEIGVEQKPVKVMAAGGRTRDEVLIKFRLLGVYGDIKLPFDKDKK